MLREPWLTPAIDRLFVGIDDLMWAGKWEDLNLIMEMVNPVYYPTEYLLAFLTAILPAASACRNYMPVVQKIAAEVEVRHPDIYKDLLHGLV